MASTPTQTQLCVDAEITDCIKNDQSMVSLSTAWAVWSQHNARGQSKPASIYRVYQRQQAWMEQSLVAARSPTRRNAATTNARLHWSRGTARESTSLMRNWTVILKLQVLLYCGLRPKGYRSTDRQCVCNYSTTTYSVLRSVLPNVLINQHAVI